MPNIRTLGELKGNRPDSGHSSDEEDRQGFFVGGSERSGQQVLGPNDGDMVAERLFRSAQRHGAETLGTDEAANFHNGPVNEGFRLGQRGEMSEQVLRNRGDPSVDRVHVIFWQDGFSIDDGPLRPFTDPASLEFLRAIDNNQVPPELQQKHRNRPIDLHLERRPTPYVKPKPKPFSSGGVRLGAVVPEVVTLDGPSGSCKPTPEESQKLLESAQNAVGLKEGEPTGRIQIRQPNGERLIGIFNPTHTVEDVRSFIVTAIEDESKTVKEADILNAVVAIKHVA